MLKQFRTSKAISSVKAGLSQTSNSITIFNKMMDFIAHIGALFGGGLAVMGTASAVGGRASAIDLASSPLPLRVVALLVISASMGWILGVFVGWLSKDPSEGRRVLGILTAAICGCLLIFSVDWLAVFNQNKHLPELQVFAAIGLGVALWIAAFQFRMQADQAGNSVIRDRALALMTFGFVSVALTALTLAGQY